MLESVLRFMESLMWLDSEHRTVLLATVLIDHEEVFLGISQLCQLLVPFTLVLMQCSQMMPLWLIMMSCVTCAF